MPHVEHEPWCEDHSGDEYVGGNGSGMCVSFSANFGPLDELPPDWSMEPMSRGCVSAQRIGGLDPEVFIDYRAEGAMDPNALRAVREAVAESPAEFLTALDRLIEALGTDVPAAHRVGAAIGGDAP